MSTATERLAAWGYEAAWAGAKVLPVGLGSAIGDRAADLAFRRRGPSVVQYARNLRRVLGTAATPELLSRTVQLGLRSYARYWLETFRLPAMDHRAVAEEAVASTTGLEYLDRAMEAGRGVLVALPHSGNWDIAALMVGRRYGGLTTVAERLKPESLFTKFVAYRESLGMEVLPLTGGATPVSQILKDRLSAGGIVCLVGDRDLSSSGVRVDFFGEPTKMPPGPAMLASLTGADLCPVHLTFTDDGGRRGWKQVIRPPVVLPGVRLAEQVRGGTQLLADAFAADIASRPQDWHMLQRLWTADLRPEQSDAAKARVG